MTRRPILRAGNAETTRVEAFSDGVLAIVITLLVLDLRVPQDATSDAALWHALLALWPMAFAWVVSFAFVLVFWVAHHALFAALAHINRGVLWLNGLFLLCVSFTPFPTALEARYPGSHPATFLMAAAMFLSASSFALLRWYATQVAGLARTTIPPASLRRAIRRSLLGPALYAVAVLAASHAAWLSLAIEVLVPLIFFLPSAVEIESPQPSGPE